MKKGVLPLIVSVLLTLSAAALLLYELETYYEVTHNEVAFSVCFYTALVALITGVLFYKNRDSFKAYKYVCAICAVILILVFYLGNKIPFCVDCDQTTAEELGILTYWIKPVEAYKP